MSDNDAGLVAQGLGKLYDGNWAIQDVSLRIEPGTVVALVGHNGAGKSTLLRALSGAERPDEGEVLIDGKRVVMSSPADAAAAGIACVYQELSLVDQLTVAQNLYLGCELNKGGILSRKEMADQTDRLCEEFKIPVSSSDMVGDLPVAQRQMVEVVRAVHRGSRYLLLDEPTTALELAQIEQLLETIRALARDRGIGVMLVDHKLDEVFAVAEKVIALSNGHVVLQGTTDEVDRAAVVRAVVGHDSASVELDMQAGTVALESSPMDAGFLIDPQKAIFVADHIRSPRLRDVSLSVEPGQILGIYGLVGAGRSRFLRTVYGVEPLTSGSFLIKKEEYVPRSARYAIQRHIALVPEERKRDGFIPMMSGRDNAALPVLDRFERFFFLMWARIRANADEIMKRVTVRGDVSAPLSRLSGGNQQKVLFAKAIMQSPQVLLLDEPTKGVDIGAKEEIHSLIRGLAEKTGAAVLMVSSEEEELIDVADVVTVFRGGFCDGVVYPAKGLTQARLRELAWSEEGLEPSEFQVATCPS